MFESGSSERQRRTARERVRACDDGLQSTPAVVPVVSGYARYVGRVGALAIALGVGSFLAAIPSAFADTSGSAGTSGATGSSTASGSTGPSRATGSSNAPGSAGPTRTAERGSRRAASTTPGPISAPPNSNPRTVDVTATLPRRSTLNEQTIAATKPNTGALSRPGSGDNNDLVVSDPMMADALAPSRRTLGGVPQSALPAASVSNGVAPVGLPVAAAIAPPAAPPAMRTGGHRPACGGSRPGRSP